MLPTKYVIPKSYKVGPLAGCVFSTSKNIPNKKGNATKKKTTWKAKCPIFKVIVAGFRGKVAEKNRTLGVPGTSFLGENFQPRDVFLERLVEPIQISHSNSSGMAPGGGKPKPQTIVLPGPFSGAKFMKIHLY